MPLDGITLRFAVQELQCLVGGRIDRATQPEKDMAVLLIRNENSRNLRLAERKPCHGPFPYHGRELYQSGSGAHVLHAAQEIPDRRQDRVR